MSNNDNGPHDDNDVVWRDDGASTRLPSEGLLSIDNVARMFGISRLALRSYEVRGLISCRQRVGRTRVYGWPDCNRIAFIIKGRRAGLALSDLTEVLKAADDGAAPEAVRAGRAKCLDLIDQLDRKRETLRAALAELRHLYTPLSNKLQDDDPGAG